MYRNLRTTLQYIHIQKRGSMYTGQTFMLAWLIRKFELCFYMNFKMILQFFFYIQKRDSMYTGQTRKLRWLILCISNMQLARLLTYYILEIDERTATSNLFYQDQHSVVQSKKKKRKQTSTQKKWSSFSVLVFQTRHFYFYFLFS